MRIAFFPYDILILSAATIIFGILLKKTVFKNHTYRDGIDKLFPYLLAYIPVAVMFTFVFEEVPVKFFLHDSYYEPKPPGPSPQGPVYDMKRVYALGYNFIILVFCIVIVVRHFFYLRKQRQKK